MPRRIVAPRPPTSNTEWNARATTRQDAASPDEAGCMPFVFRRDLASGKRRWTMPAHASRKRLPSGLAPSLSRPALAIEVQDQLREFIVLGVEVGQRQFERLREQLLGPQVGLVHAVLVAVDPGTGDEFVQPHLDPQVALRDSVGLPRLVQTVAVDR